MRRIFILIFLLALTLMTVSCGIREAHGDKLMIRCVTEEGEPLKGASFQVCSDTSCSVFTADEDGILLLEQDRKGNLVHVAAPKGYECAGEKSFTLDAPETRVVFRKK